jgi:hypothetical protein
MSDTAPVNQAALRHNAPKALPPKAQPGELLFEFNVERTHTFYRCELRDHGSYGVEAQFLDPIDLVIGHSFPTRELATALGRGWARCAQSQLASGQSALRRWRFGLR